jgi:hypothetical protein
MSVAHPQPNSGRFENTFLEERNVQLINHFEGLESGLMPLSRKEFFFKSAPDLAEDMPRPPSFNTCKS